MNGLLSAFNCNAHFGIMDRHYLCDDDEEDKAEFNYGDRGICWTEGVKKLLMAMGVVLINRCHYR